jgi:hydroxypyruvate isomerase
MKVTSYLNLNFNEGAFPERVDRAAATGVDGIEVFGWNLGLGYGSDDPGFDLDAVAERVEAHDLEFVYLSGARPDLTDPERNADALKSIERSIELAEEYGVQNVNVKAGAIQSDLDRETQRQNVVEVLRAAAPPVEDSDVTLVLEPLPATDHFLRHSSDGYAILDAVDSPSVKLLLDLHHEQVVRGNLIGNLRQNAAEYLGHVHVADPPPRAEPGTGEINWDNVFAAVNETDYDGYMGGEFIPSDDPIPALETLVELGERYE